MTRRSGKHHYAPLGYTGPKTKVKLPKRRPYNKCNNCGHFRSDHRSSHECKVENCECKEMVFA